ncbi:sortase [Anaerobacillus sp. 1_MG-2023]|uniref:sortase n=1 Tax=Anaerobacillus sp. 1_MG-2023 TaxID=3062655 RepID=UPI0026E445E0|nr:sortase [Anaerobacillus sp. 1_MG-2023]MDO6658722.1 sortase [Anaerobacillus sp. 1_MG-2023]
MGFVTYGVTSIYLTDKRQNDTLTFAKEMLDDPKTEIENSEQQINTENNLFHQADIIGVLEIPALQAEMPVLEGTSEEQLSRGVGHYSKTGMPGDERQILLAGHRETSFRKAGDLKEGDHIKLHLPSGTSTYIIDSFRIVKADDPTVIETSGSSEYLLLSTCYPFRYVGNAPERYLIKAVPD